MDASELARQYSTALQAALLGKPVDPAALGAGAVASGLGLSAVLPAHEAVLLAALAAPEPLELVRRASAFLAAFVAPLEQAQAALALRTRAIDILPEVLLKGVPAIVYVAPWQGEPGEMLYVSPQAETILGHAMPDWITSPRLWIDCLDAEDRDRVLAERAVAVSERTAFVTEYRLLSANGRIVWVHDEARIVPDEAGRPVFWQGVLLDITERKAAEQEAAEAERMRLARELHDSVSQSLLAVTVHARTLPRVWRADPQDAEARLAELESLASTALAQLRMLLLELRPTELTRVALHHLLAQLAAAARSRTSAAIRLSVEPIPLLPPHVQLAFYRIAQEALNNAAQHAGASAIDLALRPRYAGFELLVTDDGRGFDPAELPAGHFGVKGMRERAVEIGARLAVDSSACGGARIHLVWPAA